MTVTLFAYRHSSKRSTEAIIEFLGLNVNIIYVEDSCGGDLSSKALGLDARFQNIGSQESKYYERLFEPNECLLPALYDGTVNLKLSQTVAVNRYLVSLAHDTKGLLGYNPVDHFEILMWTSRIVRSVETEAQPFVRRVLGCPKSHKDVTSTLQNTFGFLEDHLRNNTYLVGEKLTLADIENVPVVADTFRECSAFRWDYPAIFRWIYTVMSSQVFDNKSNMLNLMNWRENNAYRTETHKESMINQSTTRGWSPYRLVAYSVSLESPVLIESRYNVLNMYPLAALQDMKLPRFTYIASGEILSIGLISARPKLNHLDYLSVRVDSDNEDDTIYVLKHCFNGFEVLAHFDVEFGEYNFYATDDDDVDRFGIFSEVGVSKYDFSQTRGALEPIDMGDAASCVNDGFFPLSESWILNQSCDCLGPPYAEIYNYRNGEMKYVCDLAVYEKIIDFCTIPGYQNRFLLCCGSTGFVIELDEKLNDNDDDDVSAILQAPYIGGHVHLSEMSSENIEFFTNGNHIASINHDLEWTIYDADIGSALRLGNKYFEKDGVISFLERTESGNLEAECFLPDGSRKTVYTNGYVLKEIGFTRSLLYL